MLEKSIEQLAASISELAKALQPVQALLDAAVADGVIKAPGKTEAPAGKVAPRDSTKETKPAAAPKAADPAEPTKAVNSDGEVSLSQLQALGSKLVATGKKARFAEVLESFGAKKLGELKAQDYADVHEQLSALVG